MSDELPSEKEYVRQRLVPRIRILALIAAATWLLVVVASPVDASRANLVLASGFVVVALAAGRLTVPSGVLLHALVVAAFAVGGVVQAHWAVLAVVAFSALAPLPSPARELQSAIWLLGLSLLGIGAQAEGAPSSAGVLAAIGTGWAVSVATSASWRRSWADADAHRRLAASLAQSQQELEAAVQRTRREVAQQHEQLVEQERMATLGRLAAGIAHEINNPLAVAQTNLEMALKDGPDPALLEDARQALRRIRGIVSDLTKVARPDDLDGQTTVPLDQVVAYAVDVVRTIVKDRVTVRVQTTPGVRVIGNRTRLEQVLVNLLANASQAIGARDRGEIVVSAREVAGAIEVHIDDDGPGIPPELVHDIFEPFFTTKPAGEGTGLGLAISRSYMRAMGGDLIAERAPIGGARFTLTVPLAPPEPVAAEEGLSLPAPGTERVGGVREGAELPALLLVDDEAALRRSLSRGLRKEWRVYPVANGKEAVEIVRRERIDVILCDLVLGDEHGTDVLREVQKHWPEVLAHTVLMTGEPAGSNLLAVARTNAQHVARKPFEMDELRHRLQEARQGHWQPVKLEVDADATPVAVGRR